MKKITLLAAAALIVATSFSSCKKCVTCTVGGSTTPEFCSKKKSERDAFKLLYTSSGGTCTSK